ncbi:MAG: hypothetical protein GX567_09960 [Clostridia bacterium]|nr:hypothetical protein [Clostridia bacterium]
MPIEIKYASPAGVEVEKVEVDFDKTTPALAKAISYDQPGTDYYDGIAKFKYRLMTYMKPGTYNLCLKVTPKDILKNANPQTINVKIVIKK